MTVKEFQNLSKDEQQAVILAMKPRPDATPPERARFEILRRVAMGNEVTAEELAGLEAAELYNSIKGTRGSK